MVQHQRFTTSTGEPFVNGDDVAAIEHFDGVGTESDIDAATDVTHRHGVEALADTHPRLGVDPRCEVQRSVEGLGGQWLQRQRFGGEMLTHAQHSSGDVAPIIETIGDGDQLVELGEAGDMRDGNEVTATEAADLTFHATLLMGAGDTGLAEERVEPVVRAERHEPFRLGAVATLEHAHHSRLQVVVADSRRHPAEVFEGTHMTVQEHLLSLVQIDAMESSSRR